MHNIRPLRLRSYDVEGTQFQLIEGFKPGYVVTLLELDALVFHWSSVHRLKKTELLNLRRQCRLCIENWKQEFNLSKRANHYRNQVLNIYPHEEDTQNIILTANH